MVEPARMVERGIEARAVQKRPRADGHFGRAGCRVDDAVQLLREAEEIVDRFRFIGGADGRCAGLPMGSRD